VFGGIKHTGGRTVTAPFDTSAAADRQTTDIRIAIWSHSAFASSADLHALKPDVVGG
jgi:hypothetical protein